MTPRLWIKNDQKWQRTNRYQRGIAMVEATIVLPLLFLLALGGAELGRTLELYNVINKQQQDGARYLSSKATIGTTGVVDLTNPVTAQIIGKVKNLVVYGNVDGTGDPLVEGLSTGDVTVSSPVPGHIRVAVDYNFTPIFGGVLSMLIYGNDSSLSFPLRSSVVMRVVG